MKAFLKKILSYVRPMWEGPDNKLSEKRVMALITFAVFLSPIHSSDHKLDLEFALICGMVGIAAYSNFKERQLGQGGEDK